MEQVKRDEAGGLIDAQTAALSARRLAGELYRQTGPAKVAAAAEHVRALLDAGQKVLVFAHHTEVLDALQQRALAGTPFVRIDGQVSNDKRKALVDRFQQDERRRAALLSITAAGVGITLTAASVVVFAELYWNPGSLVQAEDRAHRMGQRQALEVHYLVAPGTADDAIWQTCKHKLAVVGDTLGQERAEEAFEVVPSQERLTPAKRPAAALAETPAAATPRAPQQQQHPQQHQQQQQQHRHQHQQQRRQQQNEPEVITISDSESEGPAEARPTARHAQQARHGGTSTWHEQLMTAAQPQAAAARGSSRHAPVVEAGRGSQREQPAPAPADVAAERRAAADGMPNSGCGAAGGSGARAGAAQGPASSAETARWDEGGNDWGAAQEQSQHAQHAEHMRPRQLAGGGGEDGEACGEPGVAKADAEVPADALDVREARRKRPRPGPAPPAAASPAMAQSP